MGKRSTNRLQRRLKTRTPNLHRAQERLNTSADGRVAISSRTNQRLGGHRVPKEKPDTNWRLRMFTFPPSRTIADPSSRSRVRCAAPNHRRALDRSGRLCKISPLGRKVSLRKGKNKDKIRIYLTSTGILIEGVISASGYRLTLSNPPLRAEATIPATKPNP